MANKNNWYAYAPDFGIHGNLLAEDRFKWLPDQAFRHGHLARVQWAWSDRSVAFKGLTCRAYVWVGELIFRVGQ